MAIKRGSEKRRLEELISVGEKIVEDFSILGVQSVKELARRSPNRLYEQLCEITKQRQDPCVLDVFCAAVAQARNPHLPAEQCQWWYWSRQRKARDAHR
jgi:hypothetical protein